MEKKKIPPFFFSLDKVHLKLHSKFLLALQILSLIYTPLNIHSLSSGTEPRVTLVLQSTYVQLLDHDSDRTSRVNMVFLLEIYIRQQEQQQQNPQQ